MKNKRGPAPKGAKKGKRGFSNRDDSFFEDDSKRQRTKKTKDADFEVSSDSDDDFVGGSDRDGDADEEDEKVEETADETRKRLAIAHLEKLREIAKRAKEDEDESGKESEKEGERDSLVAQILQQKQLEESGRVRRSIASR